MRTLTLRLRAAEREQGAVLVFVAITLFSLLAVSALVIDVGAMVQERRTLQNSADAAALAVAKDCSTGPTCGSYSATAASYTNSNADDGTSNVEGVCGTTPLLPACTNPPAVPTGAGYVRVSTKTRSTDGTDVLPFSLARVMGFTGAIVHRQAVAAWGAPKSLVSGLPLTISLCEYSRYTLNGTQYVTEPIPTNPWPAERVLYFHNTTQAPSCNQGPSGADLPGGFGWLQTSTDCETASAVDSWFNDSTGRPPPSSCDVPELAALKGTIVYVPVYDNTNGLNGSNGQYHIKGYAAFYLTGYSINGQYKQKSLVTGNPPCGGSDSCISGFFVGGEIVPSSGAIGGPSMGVNIVKLVG
jgi:hypothetical protein